MVRGTPEGAGGAGIGGAAIQRGVEGRGRARQEKLFGHHSRPADWGEWVSPVHAFAAELEGR